MAIQSSIYVTDGSTRTYPSTKHIATKQHCSVLAKKVIDSLWEVVSINDYTLVNNSIVFTNAPLTSVYSNIEIRVADTLNELTTSPSDIAIVSANIASVNIVAIDILDVNSVALNIGVVGTVSGSISSVNTVSGNIATVNTVSSNILNVNTVASNVANVNAVGLDLLEPTSEINTVAVSIANVDAVGLSISNVNIVATDIVNINSVANTIVPNIAEILLADTNASTATTQATNAQLSAWEAEAERMTADSYATEAEDVFVKIYTSVGNGTFTNVNSTEYSSLHWAAKSALTGASIPAIDAALGTIYEGLA